MANLRSQDVLLILADLFLGREIPTNIRSDNGPEFIASKLRQWMNGLQVAPLMPLILTVLTDNGKG